MSIPGYLFKETERERWSLILFCETSNILESNQMEGDKARKNINTFHEPKRKLTNEI